MIRFGELMLQEEIRKKLGLRSLEERVFRVWISWENIFCSLESNDDKNRPHRDPEAAGAFIKRVFPDAIDALPLEKPFLIAPGLLLLTNPEKIGIDVGLKYFDDPLLPIQLQVVWQWPLIVLKDEPQLVEFVFKPVGKEKCVFEVWYSDKRFRKFFSINDKEQPIMRCYSKREQVSPFVFSLASNPKSGIDKTTRNEFRRVIEGQYYERRVSPAKSNPYWNSVGLPVEVPERIYGEENVAPTEFGAKIPSDTPLAIGGEEIYRGKIFLWSSQKLCFNPARPWERDKKLLMKVFPGRESKRTVKIFGREMKMKIQFVEEAFLDEECLREEDRICCLGKSVIMSPL